MRRSGKPALGSELCSRSDLDPFRVSPYASGVQQVAPTGNRRHLTACTEPQRTACITGGVHDDPGGGMALGVALLPTSQALGRSASICGRLIVSCRSSRLGSFAWPLRGRPRLRRRFGFAAFGLMAPASPALQCRRIPANVLHQMAIHRPRNQRLMDGSQDGSRQTRKRPAKTSPRSEAGPPLQPHSRRSLPSTSRRSITRRSERRTRPWL